MRSAQRDLNDGEWHHAAAVRNGTEYMRLYIDGELVGQTEIAVTNPIILGLTSGVAVGADPGSPVTEEYHPPFDFTGKIYFVTIDVSGDLIRDTEAEMRAIIARQ